MQFLNQLYTVFDDLVDEYDLYKLDTVRLMLSTLPLSGLGWALLDLSPPMSQLPAI